MGDGSLSDVRGIHHVTAMVGAAQPAIDCLVAGLGLRLVKRTVNHEDVLGHHLYVGNRRGEPGTIYTVFPHPHEPPGRRGRPQWQETAFAVPPGSIEWWAGRLEDRDVTTERAERFGDAVLRFADPAGTRLALVAARSPFEPWADGPVPAAQAIRGLHSATALSAHPFETAGILETLGFDHVGQSGDRVRYQLDDRTWSGDVDDVGNTGDHDRGSAVPATARTIDLLDRDAAYGREGPGTIHHVALLVADDELRAWHDLFRDRDVHVSRIRDRHYYRSIYVRGPGGILFELATAEPGLTVDEPAALGSSLVLPPWAEADRAMIESQLPPIDVPDH